MTQPQPFKAYFPSGNHSDQDLGKRLAKKGKCGALMLAGGQASRLRLEGPKGTFPISVVKKKSLFQLFAEKVVAVSRQLDFPIPLAVMTSPLNHVETETFFIQNAYFGLASSQVFFFTQEMLPFHNFKEETFYDAPGHLAQGPNGNGSVYARFVASGIWERWKEAGVEMVHVFQVDNPLAPPIDFELFGFHQRMEADVTIKATPTQDPKESVGILARLNGKCVVLEYFERDEAFFPDDALANIGLYCFSMSFIEKVSHQALPMHRAKKAVKMLDENGKVIFPNKPNAWKTELFIFDAFVYSDRTYALVYPREDCFAPLKNLEGADSIGTVQEALVAYERKLFERISGHKLPSDLPIELAPSFYYPTQALLEKWKGKPFSGEAYIED